MRLVDTHAHLDFPDFDADRSRLIKELAAAEIGVIDVATDSPSIDRVDALSRQEPLIWGAIGLHPTEIGPTTLTALPALTNQWASLIAANPKIVAIGEIGLDYFRGRERASEQKAALRQQLTFAQEQQRPVIFHCRDAYGDLATILADYQIRGVVHCFSGNAEQAERFLQLGLYLSATAIVTYPKNAALAAVFKTVPADRLLLETDSPFLPSADRRGERNDPRTVVEIGQFLAGQRDQAFEQLASQTTANAQTLFKLEE